MTQVGLIVVGLPGLLRAFDGLAEDFDETIPALEEAADLGYYPAMQELFETEGYGRWKGRSPAYERSLRRRYGEFFDLPVGQVTGGLKRSFTLKGAPSNVHVAVGENALLLGSRRGYAAAFSNVRPVELDERGVERIEGELSEALQRRAERRGFKAL